MPYDSISELPRSVRDHLPKHAQQIYRESFNDAWKRYAKPSDRRGSDSRETTARKVAWSAVKESYEKKGDDWVRKS
jgi:cation transport regulator